MGNKVLVGGNAVGLYQCHDLKGATGELWGMSPHPIAKAHGPTAGLSLEAKGDHERLMLCDCGRPTGALAIRSAVTVSMSTKASSSHLIRKRKWRLKQGFKSLILRDQVYS